MWLQVHICICVHAPLSSFITHDAAAAKVSRRNRSTILDFPTAESPHRMIFKSFFPSGWSFRSGDWSMVSCTHVCAVYQKNKTNMLAKKYPTPFHIPLKLVRKSKSSIMFGCGSKPDNRLSYWISLDVYLPKLFLILISVWAILSPSNVILVHYHLPTFLGCVFDMWCVDEPILYAGC